MSKRRAAPVKLDPDWSAEDQQKYDAAEAESQVEAPAAAEPAAAVQTEALELAPQIRAAIDDGPKLKFAEAVLGNLGDDCDGYAASHVEVGNLKPAERDILKRLRTGLSDAHVKLESGKHVESAADVVRWLLQQVATLARSQAG